MKKIYKIFIILNLLIVFFPNNVLANENIYYYGTNQTNPILTFENTDISISILDVVTNDDSILLKTYVNNPSYIQNTMDLKIYFYDKENNLIGKNTHTIPILGKDSNFSVHLSTKEIELLEGFNIEQIAYYKMMIGFLNNTNQFSYDGYYLNSYDININVNENNTFNITEKIGAYFDTDKHGIFRKIPLKNKVTRLDGTTSTNRAKISNVSVSDKYSLYNEKGYKVIKIGDAKYTLKGQKNYTINYLYNIGKDTGKGYDELYFNLIGDEWDTSISNITFTITMPKEFDESKLGFSSGKTGSTDSSNVIFDVNGNIITGRLSGILNPGEALTVRLELPESYFVGASYNLDLMMIITIILPIIFVITSYFIWKKYGKDDQVVETVEFYPPQGFNSLEVGFLYKGKAEDQDVVSLLIYLANKGYIKISEYEEKKLFSKTNGFKITKLREYDGNNINEKMFFDDLFIDNFTETTSESLYNSFYKTINKIKHNINNKENKNKIFEKKASSKTVFVVLMIIATYCLITIPPIYAYGEPENISSALLFPGIGFTTMFTMLLSGPQTIYVNGTSIYSALSTKISGLLVGACFGVLPWAGIVLPALLEDYMYLAIYIIGLICVLGLVICLKYLPKRTSYGNEMLGKLRGFKNFLETAEKDKLEAMVMQNPSYFYDILPYTYVLGVSDKWIKKFETISMQAPSWYDSPNDFNVHSFGSFVNNTMTSAQTAMTSSPSSSSSGSSGGGSSGGGSGGGGGGSW